MKLTAFLRKLLPLMMAATVTVCSANSFAAAGSSDSANLADATFGLDIVKIGDDAQTYDQADLLVGNVFVEAGMLSLSDVASVAGDIYVASGATLVTGGEAISLGAGQTLTAQSGASVTLAGLSLDGGTLSLDLGAPTGAPEEAPSLSLASAVAGSGGVITLVGDLSSLETAQIMLAKGDWSHFANGGLSLESLSLLGGGSSPLNYSLMANSEGLYLSLAAPVDGNSNIGGGTEVAQVGKSDSFSVYGSGVPSGIAGSDGEAAYMIATLSDTSASGAEAIDGGAYNSDGSGSAVAPAAVGGAEGGSASGAGADYPSLAAAEGDETSASSYDATSDRIINDTWKIDSDVNVSGTGRITIAPSGKIELADGASLNRPEDNSGAYWIQGDLVALENATADFSTVDDVHFYEVDNGEIKLESGSTLNMQAKSLQYWRPASINLGENSTLNLTTTNGLDDSTGQGTPKIAISLADGAAFNVLGGVVNINGSSSLSLGNNAKVNFNGGDVTFDSGATLTMGAGSDLKVSSGTMKIQSDIGAAGVASTITLAGGSVQLNGGTQTVYSTIRLENAAVFTKYNSSQPTDYTHLSTVELMGAKGTVKSTNWNGALSIGALNSELESGSQLVLDFNHSADFISLVKLGASAVPAGNFSGTITMKGTNNGNKRGAALIIENADIAKMSVIDIEAPLSSTAEYAVAINVDNATIGGLNSTVGTDSNGNALGNQYSLFSGSVDINKQDTDDSLSSFSEWIVNGAERTLNLNVVQGGNYTFTGGVLKTNSSVLNLTKSGSGSQTFSGEAHVGDISVSNGELVLSNASSTISGDITVSGGLLDFDGTYTLGDTQTLSVLTGEENAVQLGNLTLSGGELVFDASLLNADTSALSVGTVSLGDGTSSQLITFNNIDNLESGRYLLSDSWTAMDGLSFTTNTLTNGTANVLMQDGALYLDYTSSLYLVWTGSNDANWNYSSSNWDSTPHISTDADVLFSAGKIAIFETDANVTVSEAVSADSLIVRNGATLNLTERASLTVNSIDVAVGSTLAFKTEKADYTVDYITGSGTVELSLSAEYENSLRLEGFAGEVYVKSGRFDLFEATAVSTGAENTDANQVAQLGSKLHLGAGVNMQIEGGKTVIVDADMQLDGSTEVHQNSSAILTLNGNVTGVGTWLRKGGGTLTFNGAVTLAGFISGGGTNLFNDSVSLSSLNISGGTVNFNAASELTSATVTGGTVNFNGTSEVAAMTVSGGTVEFKGDTKIGTLSISGDSVTLHNATANAGENKIIGAVKLANEAVLNQYSADKTTTYTLLDSLELTGASGTIKLSNWHGAMSIASLYSSNEGGSELKLNYNHTADYFSMVKLGSAMAEAGNFSGTITMESTQGGNRRGAALIIENADIAKNAVIRMSTPASARAEYALGINADNVTIAGLSSTPGEGRENQFSLFSGEMNHNLQDDSDTMGFNGGWIKNGAKRTLTFNVAEGGDYTFTGNVVKTDSSVLSLVKTGAGSQTISGEAAVGSVAVQEGALILSNASSTISGDISVSGGQLDFGGTYTLGDSLTLSVLTGTENAVQLGGMTLSGGQMLFDASLLTSDSAALSLSSAAVYTAGTTQTVSLDFSKLTGALANGTYKLASGDWSGAYNDTLTYTGMGSATFNATADGLYLVYSNDGVYTWVGGAADTNWSSANWDIVPDSDASNNLSFADNKDAIFNTNATAVVTDAVTAGTVYILNGADVTFDMNGEGASLTADTLVVGDGKLTMGEGVSTTSINNIVVSEAGTLVIHQPQALGGNNGTLGKVSGAGTLVIDLASANTVVYATGRGNSANLGNFTGTVDVTKGWLVVGNTNTNQGGAQSDFNAGKVIVRNGATLSTHFGVGKHDDNNHTIFASDIDLMNGAVLLNIDGSTRYTGNIRFNVVDPAADTPTYDANGLVKIDQHWQKKLEFSGLLEGDGTVQLTNAAAEAKAVYMITGENNTFAGTFELIDDSNENTGKIIELRLGTETAAQFADIKLSSTHARSYLMLDSDITINGLYGVVDGENAVQAQGAERTLTVSVGDFGGILQDSTGKLSLIKQGSGTLILRGANTYTGTTSITGGTLELAGAVSMAANGGEISVNSGATLLLNTTQTLTLNNVISGQGTIHKKGTQEVILTGNITTDVVKIADGTNQKANAGTLTLAGKNVEIAKQLYVAHGSLNIGSGDGSSSFVVTKQLEVGDSNPADNSGATASITVREGSTLTVTGNNNGESLTGGFTGDKSHKNASFLLSEWGSVSTLTVEGAVLVQNAKVTMGDNKTIININGGTLAAQGITDVRTTRTGTGLELSLTNDGKLIMGEAGLNTAQSSVKVELGEGTVGMSAASTTIAENVTLNSAEGTTFDTTQYTYETNADGVATDIVRGTEGGDLVLSGNVSSAEGVDAAMKVVGAGTLHVAGEAAVSGDVTVDTGATLAVSAGNTAKATIRSADGAAAATISGGVTLSLDENSAAIAGRGMDVTEISNSLIELQQGVSLKLSNVHLAADSAVMGAGAAQATSGVMLMEGELTRNDVALESVSVAIALDQNATRGADAAVEGVGSKVMMLDSSAFTYNNLTGSLTVEFSGELAAMLLQGGYDAVGLSFTGSEMATNMTILGMYDGITGSTKGIFATNAGSSAVVYFSTDIIPEPATGTLSLLALAALAMRRRRR